MKQYWVHIKERGNRINRFLNNYVGLLAVVLAGLGFVAALNARSDLSTTRDAQCVNAKKLLSNQTLPLALFLNGVIIVEPEEQYHDRMTDLQAQLESAYTLNCSDHGQASNFDDQIQDKINTVEAQLTTAYVQKRIRSRKLVRKSAKKQGLPAATLERGSSDVVPLVVPGSPGGDGRNGSKGKTPKPPTTPPSPEPNPPSGAEAQPAPPPLKCSEVQVLENQVIKVCLPIN